MRRLLVPFVVFACCWQASALRAELTWAQKTVELQADAKTSVLEARYRFTNVGKTPVDIQQVQTSCGCTSAALDQRHYEPGGSGEIVVRFTVGERVGLQKKTILVSTSDDPLVPTALTLVVRIPEPLRVQPAFVMWQQGEAPSPKIIDVEAGQAGTLLKEVVVQSANTAMSARLQTVSDGRKYQIVVTPETTDKPVFVILTLRCRVGAEEKTVRAYASVPAPMPTPPAKSPALVK